MVIKLLALKIIMECWMSGQSIIYQGMFHVKLMDQLWRSQNFNMVLQKPYLGNGFSIKLEGKLVVL